MKKRHPKPLRALKSLARRDAPAEVRTARRGLRVGRHNPAPVATEMSPEVAKSSRNLLCGFCGSDSTLKLLRSGEVRSYFVVEAVAFDPHCICALDERPPLLI